ncbi:CG0192-related protein [Micromonospora sp. H33]|uniref:CG0192-related protein n=1 Tax=Micromonospora sp. H33 TaxID=3452215 RepID=UPI003F8BDA84
MALLHRADLKPGKLELLAAWLPGRPWFVGEAGAEVTRVAACRFDDPAGEVGVETLLVRAGAGPVLHVPLTYRAAPLDGGDEWLVGTTEHSVLGRRWVYDGCGDPVHAAVLASVLRGDAGQAEEYFEVDGVREVREPLMTVTAEPDRDIPAAGAIRRVEDADPTVIVTDTVELAVLRTVGTGTGGGAGTLTGAWPGGPGHVALAYAVPR